MKTVEIESEKEINFAYFTLVFLSVHIPPKEKKQSVCFAPHPAPVIAASPRVAWKGFEEVNQRVSTRVKSRASSIALLCTEETL